MQSAAEGEQTGQLGEAGATEPGTTRAAPTKQRERLGERWNDVSLRAKITGVTVFILSLGLIVAGIGTQSFLRPQLIMQIDTELGKLWSDPALAFGPEADMRALQCEYVHAAAGGRYYIAILDADGEKACDNSVEDLENLMPIVPSFTTSEAEQIGHKIFDAPAGDGVKWRVTLIPINSPSGEVVGTLVAAASTAPANIVMARFVLVFSGFSIAVLLLGAALTRILVTNTFAPLAEVERTALEIARGDYSKRIMVSNAHTEVGHLGQSLNVMLDRIDASFDERARTIEQMRRFISDAGHELRTPLVSVRGYAEMYRHGWLTEEEQLTQAMGRIENEAIRMGLLVDDLLALARLDEKRPLDQKPLQLNKLASDTALDTHAQAPDREVSVVEDPSNPIVTGDEHKVRQVMTNLIGNALRYSPEGTPIQIRVTSDAARGTTSFAIIDHGEGIPEQFRTKIFDRFWRADTSRNRETGGSGLGLAIVQSIVQAHGGSVSAHETPGGGATFRVELPLGDETGTA